jgi:hypothetical protein
MDQENIHIPCGFRCWTENFIRNNLGINQASLPFDYGFFTPRSIINFLESETCEFNLHNTSPGMKFQNAPEICFETTSYEKINDHMGYTKSGGIALPVPRGVTRYLHGGRLKYPGYYTICKDYGFVMSNYIYPPWSAHYTNGLEQDFKNLNSIMNRRKIRLLELMKSATTINLYMHEGQGFKFMKIDAISSNIMEDQHLLLDYVRLRFPGKHVNMIATDTHST